MTPNTPLTPTPPPAPAEHTRINSQDLFQGQQEILIEHAAQIYRLRITRQGKLILTK